MWAAAGRARRSGRAAARAGHRFAVTVHSSQPTTSAEKKSECNCRVAGWAATVSPASSSCGRPGALSSAHLWCHAADGGGRRMCAAGAAPKARGPCRGSPQATPTPAPRPAQAQPPPPADIARLKFGLTRQWDVWQWKVAGRHKVQTSSSAAGDNSAAGPSSSSSWLQATRSPAAGPAAGPAASTHLVAFGEA